MSKIYTPESQLPIVLNVSLPPGLILGHPRSSYAWVPASHHPQCKPSPWTLPRAEADVMSLVLVLSPTLSTQDPYTDLWVWTQCYPQQWSNPDYCYLEPSSRVKPEQSHQMAVSTNHNWGGRVIWLTLHLSDVENYRGFRVIAPFIIFVLKSVQPECHQCYTTH